MTRKMIFILPLGFLFLTAGADTGKNTSKGKHKPTVASKQAKGPGQRANSKKKQDPDRIRANSGKKQRLPAFDKEDILGPDYDTPPDSDQIRQEINSLLEKPATVCNESGSFDGKARSLERIFEEIRRAVRSYLKEPYLTLRDRVYLSAIEDNISGKNLSLGQPLTGPFLMSVQLDLRRQFARNYALYYGRGDDIRNDSEAFQFSHKWAEKIYQGLLCLYRDSE